MRTPLNLAILSALLCTSTFPSANGAVVASDNFDSYTVGSTIAGQTGGTGNTWQGNANSTIVSHGGSNALQIAGGVNSSVMAGRAFGAQNGDELFVSFTLEIGSIPVSPDTDFLALYLSNSLDAGNNQSQARLNMGLFTTGQLAGRYNGTIEGGAPVANTTYTLVGRFFKSTPGAANPFNSVQFWVNPTFDSLGSPLGTNTATVTGTTSTISTVGFRTALTEETDVFYIDNMVVGTTWGDVVPVPEPGAAMLAVTSLGVVLLRRGSRRRA